MIFLNPNVVAKAKQWLAADPLFLDTETTGLDERAEIVEICLVDQAGQVFFQSLVRPRRPIPPEVTRIHGITPEMVKTAPTWMLVWPKLEPLLNGRTIGIYNAEFDLKMLRQSHQAIGLPWRPPAMQTFCIMNLFSDALGSLKRFSLEEAGQRAGIALPNTHRACDDALLARELFLWICRQAG